MILAIVTFNNIQHYVFIIHNIIKQCILSCIIIDFLYYTYLLYLFISSIKIPQKI